MGELIIRDADGKIIERAPIAPATANSNAGPVPGRRPLVEDGKVQYHRSFQSDFREGEVDGDRHSEPDK